MNKEYKIIINFLSFSFIMKISLDEKEKNEEKKRFISNISFRLTETNYEKSYFCFL